MATGRDLVGLSQPYVAPSPRRAADECQRSQSRSPAPGPLQAKQAVERVQFAPVSVLTAGRTGSELTDPPSAAVSAPGAQRDHRRRPAPAFPSAPLRSGTCHHDRRI